MHDALSLFALAQPEETIAPRAAGKDTPIPPIVLAVLRSAAFGSLGTNTRFDLPRTTAKLYALAKPIIEGCGFAWVRKDETHVGDATATVTLQEAITSGTYLETKKSLEFFPTGPKGAAVLAKVLVDEMWGKSPRVLEPSAGEGALIDALLGACPDVTITAVEVDDRRVSTLRKRYGRDERVRIVHCDFLEFEESGFDAAIVNPPFAEAYAHLTHLYGRLRCGGYIAGIAMLTRPQDRELAQWLHDRDAWTDPTEETTFADTMIRASYFGLRCGHSCIEDLRAALRVHPSIREPHVRELQELSLAFHALMERYCNGYIQEPRYSETVDALLTKARAIVKPEGISVVPKWDPRAGHGFALRLPSGHGNDMDDAMVVPNALMIEDT